MILIMCVMAQVVTAKPHRTTSTNIKVNAPIPFFVVLAPTLPKKLDFHRSLLRDIEALKRNVLLPSKADLNACDCNICSGPVQDQLAKIHLQIRDGQYIRKGYG